LRGQSRDSGFEVLWRATASTQRYGEAVIEVGRAGWVKRRVGKSPRVILASQSLNSFSEDSPSRLIEPQSALLLAVRYWEIIVDNLSKAGWSWACVATVDSNGQTIFVADAHRDNGKRLVVRAEEKLTTFLELESAVRAAERPEDCGGREIKLDKLSRIM
jgi:hypothetical protein